jgi:3',5'-cyclic-AMP phosphodiesterase
MTSRGLEHSFVVISDIHAPASGVLFGRINPLDNLRLGLQMITDSGYRPEALVLSGDVAHGGESAAYRQVKAEVSSVAEALGCAVLYLPGNHDHHPDVFRTELLAPSANSADQVLWLDGLRIVGLDSSVPGREHGELTADQLSWLRTELARPAPDGSIVVLHHQPLRTPEPIVNSLALRDPAALLAAIADSDVRMIVSGHSHHASGGMFAGRPTWTAPSLSFTTDVLASSSHRYLPGGAFTRVDVFTDSVLATVVPLGTAEALIDIPFDEVYRMLDTGHDDPVRF